jgi:outer membrane immunogenic protein
MNSKLATLAVALPLAFAAAPASAQDCRGGNFAGPFIGLNLGMAMADVQLTSPGEPKISGDDGSFSIGGHAGFNVQCGNLVMGIEGDIAHIGLETKGTWDDPLAPVHLKDQIDWFGSVRGKLGVAMQPDLLLYVTGGLAFADVSHTLEAPAIGFKQTDSGWATGYVIGGGFEFLRHGNWLLRGEALFVDLGKETHTYTVAGGCGGVCTGTADWDDSFWVARLGLSYKFGAAEVRHAPMK